MGQAAVISGQCERCVEFILCNGVADLSVNGEGSITLASHRMYVAHLKSTHISLCSRHRSEFTNSNQWFKVICYI